MKFRCWYPRGVGCCWFFFLPLLCFFFNWRGSFVFDSNWVSTQLRLDNGREERYWFTLCTSEVVGDGVGDRKFDEGWRAGVCWAGWFGLIVILLFPGEGIFFLGFFCFFVGCFLGRFQSFWFRFNYYECWDVNILGIGTSFPNLRWGGASRAGRNPKRSSPF